MEHPGSRREVILHRNPFRSRSHNSTALALTGKAFPLALFVKFHCWQLDGSYRNRISRRHIGGQDAAVWWRKPGKMLSCRKPQKRP